MKTNTLVSVAVGTVLVLLGVLFLLQNFAVLGPFNNLVWTVLFGAGGVVFLIVFLGNTEHWWALIPGFSLLGLGALIGLESWLGPWAAAIFFFSIALSFLLIYLLHREFWWALIPGFTLLGLAGLVGTAERLGAWGAAIFLAAIGLGFLVIYLIRREFWWALIPAGALASTALTAGLAETVNEAVAGGVMFLGLGATFGLLYLVPVAGNERMRWALIPAGILGIMGVLMVGFSSSLAGYVWPVFLIVGGAALMWRTMTRSRSQK